MSKKAKRKRNIRGSGGAAALGGFLYQILAAAGLRASSVCSDATHNDRECELLFSLSGEATISHEALGEDIAFTLKKGDIALIQCKFSLVPGKNTIPTTELKKIAAHLASSWLAADHAGHPVRELFLLTNRDFAPSATKLLVTAKKKIGRRQKQKKDMWAAMARLKAATSIPPDFWFSKLEDAAAKYGVLPDELHQRVNELVGHVVTKTTRGGSYTLSHTEVVACLAGSASAHEITLAAVQPHMRTAVTDLAPSQAGEVLRRGRLRDAIEAYSQRALVAFTGKGGSGKSIALYDWTNLLYRDQMVVLTLTPREISAHTISDVVDRWRGVPNTNTPDAKALMRLTRANQGLGPPVLHVSLDGLDEHLITGSNVSDVKAFIRSFYGLDQDAQISEKPAAARLVVSCRSLEFLERFCVRNVSGFKEGLPSELAQVEFDDFSLEELLELFARNAPSLVNRVYASLEKRETLGMSLSAVPMVLASSPVTPVAASVLEALRDPAMWGAFMRDTSIQSRVLDGDPDSLRGMVGKWVGRFCSKVSDRRTYIPEQAAGVALRAVAARLEVGVHLRKEWIEAIAPSGALTEGSAGELYGEALSGGLIVEESPSRWRWRNQFVVDYLRQPANE